VILVLLIDVSFGKFAFYFLTIIPMKFCLFSLSFIYLMLSSVGYSTTYTTIADGAYDDGTCANWDWNGCPPNPINATDVVIINHVITWTLSGINNIRGVLTINTGASLIITGTSELRIKANGKLTNDGIFSIVGKLKNEGEFYNSGKANIVILHNDGYMCNSGTVTIDPNGSLHNHGGTIACGGNITVCDVLSENHDGNALITNQDFCCLSTSIKPSPWIVGATVGVGVTFCAVLLPVELSSFSLKSQEKNVLLNWETKSETDNDYFVVLRSQNGIDFEEIGELNGQGNSSVIVNYQFVDERPLYGTSYYKLQQVDYNGESSFSQILSTSFNVTDTFVLYPNPTSSDVNLMLSAEEKDDVLIEVFDVVGQLVFVQNQNLSIGTNSVPLSTAFFNEGLYFCKVTFSNGMQMKQTFVKVN